MNQSTPTPLVSFEGFTATPGLVERIESKAAKLHRHHATLVGSLHLHLRLEKPHTGPARFNCSATLRSGSRDIAIHAEADEPDALVNDLFAKFERALHEHAGERKHARHATETAPAT